MDLLSSVDEDVFLTVPDAYLRKKIPDHITFNPVTNIFMSESNFYGLNWLLIWSLACVLTEYFRNEECVDAKNYFKLRKDDGKTFYCQSWREGIRAGVQLIAAECAIPGIVHADPSIFVFPGALKAAKSPKGLKIVSDLDKLFGEGVGAKTQAVYDEVVKFAHDDGFEVPPVIAPPSVPQGPLKPIPPIEPSIPPPASVQPEPVKDGTEPAWKKWLHSVVAILGSGLVMFALGFFLPGNVIELIKQAVTLIKQLFGW